MRATPPVSITPTKVSSSSASEIFAPTEYSAGTTYSYGDLVSVAADYKIYESLEDGNSGNTPSLSPQVWSQVGVTETAYNSGTTYPLGATCSRAQRTYESLVADNTDNTPPVWPEKETDYWFDVGPTNKYAMFDLNSNTQTVHTSPLTVVFAPGERINTIGLTGMNCNTLQISATSVTGGGTIYPNENTESSTGIFDLNTRIVRNGYDYSFEPFSTIASNVIFDVPPFSDIIITVTLTSTTGNVKCGAAIAGTYIYIGDVEYSATADSLNFSTVDRDLYGNATLVPRASFPKTSQTLFLSSIYVNRVMQAKKLLDAKPALWTGLDDATSDWFEMLKILGVWKEFTFSAAGPSHSKITLSLEEI